MNDELLEEVALNNQAYHTIPYENVIDLFDVIAEKYQEKIAIETEENRITYQKLKNLSNVMAKRLLDSGVKKGDFIGVVMKRRLETISVILSILRCGAVYVPLEEEHAPYKMNYLLKDEKVKYIIVEQSFSMENSKVKRYEDIFHDLEGVMGCCVNEGKGENIPAYVNFTSGSTGEPKEVLLPHRGILRLVYQPCYVNISDKDVFMHAAPISFDASTFEIWGALLNGAKLIIVPSHLLVESKKLREVKEKFNISIMFLTTCIFNRLVTEEIDLFQSMNAVITGGDMVSKTHFIQFRNRHAEVSLIHAYGPTENTTFSCCYKVNEINENWSTIPIGGPINNSLVYILDGERKAVPVGTMGEIYVGGDGLAYGYANDEKKTKESFIPNPYRENNRIYKTGDFARWLPDGVIEFVGRIDNQVKIRGFRVELAEVKSKIQQIEGVVDCAVTTKRNESGEKYIVTYYTAEDSITNQKIIEELKVTTPDYMIPTVLYKVSKILLTDNGKIAWKETEILAIEENSELGIEEKEYKEIGELWRSVLRHSNFTKDDNFFDVGGNSLLLSDLAKQMKEHYKKQVKLVQLFRYPTIRKQFEYINKLK